MAQRWFYFMQSRAKLTSYTGSNGHTSQNIQKWLTIQDFTFPSEEGNRRQKKTRLFRKVISWLPACIGWIKASGNPFKSPPPLSLAGWLLCTCLIVHLPYTVVSLHGRNIKGKWKMKDKSYLSELALHEFDSNFTHSHHFSVYNRTQKREKLTRSLKTLKLDHLLLTSRKEICQYLIKIFISDF